MCQSMTWFYVLSLLCSLCSPTPYEPNWQSLDQRPLPSWYDEAKFGIFMHWGVYSVPSFTEWFWWHWKGEHDPNITRFMMENYKPGFSYADFATQFTAEFFDPQAFAQIVKSSRAKYFVLTSKHHEGFTLFPSNYSWNWNSVDVGPHRNLVGELATSIRDAGIKFGLYYSLYEWFNPLYLKDRSRLFSSQDYLKAKVTPQLQEIITKYKPEVLWSDGDWEASYQYWNSTEFLAWLYNSSPVKDTIVTNDRWGVGAMCKHGDFLTCSDRFSPGVLIPKKWESCMTIDKESWGYRRLARLEDYLKVQDLIEILVKTISCGGNLLLNVGPTHDGRITPIFEERLIELGKFIDINEEAIFGTKPWIFQNDTKTPDVWYTSRLWQSVSESIALNPKRLYNYQKSTETIVYAFILKRPPGGIVHFGAPKATKNTDVSLLGYGGQVRSHIDLDTGSLAVDLTSIDWTLLPDGSKHVLVFRLAYLATMHQKPKVLSLDDIQIIR